jgi:hypothetical protein
MKTAAPSTSIPISGIGDDEKRSKTSNTPSISIPPTSTTTTATTEDDDKQITEWWRQLGDRMKEVDSWVTSCSDNFRHMSLLLAAETARLKKQPLRASRLYVQATDEAKKHSWTYHEVMC